MEKVALVCDLDQSRFHEEKGIGGPQQCVKEFDSKADAERFAAEMIREYDAVGEFKSDETYAEVLEGFQEGLGGLSGSTFLRLPPSH
ncbi:MAG: hypothetical protein V4719_00970 [Planctomycetota bacterium]